MKRMLVELRQLPVKYRETDFSEKKVLCPHCLQIFQSKSSLLSHICREHARYREAARMALEDRNKIRTQDENVEREMILGFSEFHT